MNTKICKRCNLEKSLNCFHKNKCRKSQTQTYCKDCRKEYDKVYFQKNKSKRMEQTEKRRLKILDMVRKLKTACTKCGQNHPACLDFHHRDSSQKEFTISIVTTQGYSFKKVLAEISKCDVLCSNCHRILHYEEKMYSMQSG